MKKVLLALLIGGSTLFSTQVILIDGTIINGEIISISDEEPTPPGGLASWAPPADPGRIPRATLQPREVQGEKRKKLGKPAGTPFWLVRHL